MTWCTTNEGLEVAASPLSQRWSSGGSEQMRQTGAEEEAIPENT